jgi:hypothetical protein
MPQPKPRTLKVLGGRNLPSYWERFDRLQRTAHLLGVNTGVPRGIFCFADFDAFEDWRWTQRLNHPARLNAPTL